MRVRYIYNTSGEYVAFITNGYLFDPDCNWLGVIANGNEVYDKNGSFVGILTDDDRIIADNSLRSFKRVTRPARPTRPMRPLRPLRRLRMPRLPIPYKDLFEHGHADFSSQRKDLSQLNNLMGAEIIASDNTFLGVISNNRLDQNSISNSYGPHGGKYSQYSIFNQYGPYGGKYSQNSPFNQYSSTPPKIVKNGNLLGYLTANKYLHNRIDVNDFMAWLHTKNIVNV
ncbi:MAG: 4-fold beta flower protein [Balneolaceae bacterium]